MGVGPAPERHHTAQKLPRDLRQDGGRHFIGDQHHGFADGELLGFVLHQPADEPLGDVFHIGGTLPQIGILHPLELLYQPIADEFDRRDRRPVFLC